MKRLALIVSTILISCAAFAEMPSRFFEVGLDVDASLAQNITTANDLFVENLVIDLTELAENMDSNGAKVTADGFLSAFMNANIMGYKAGLYANLDVAASFGVGQELFSFLGNGNKLNEDVVASVNASLESYFEIAANVEFKLLKNFHISVSPDVFMPIAYLPRPDAKVTATALEDGTLKMTASGQFALYTAFAMSDYFDENFNFNSQAINNIDGGNITALIASGAGFDLSGNVIYELFDWINVGGYARIPIVPGRLSNSTTGKVTYSAQVDPVLNSYVSNGDFSFSSTGPEYENITYGTDTFTVNRPLRLGAQAQFKFLGGMLNVSPSLGLAARNPFGEDFDWSQSIYPEFALRAGADFWIGGVYLNTQYMKQIYSQEVGGYLNLRAMELILKIASSGTSLSKSFALGGMSASLGLRFGF